MYNNYLTIYVCSIVTDQLVCEYYNCTDGAQCVRGYEVCDENPQLKDYDNDHLACIVVLYRNNAAMNVQLKSCFSEQCGGVCALEEYPTNVYSCCCHGNLCNSNYSLTLQSHHTPIATSLSTGSYTVY